MKLAFVFPGQGSQSVGMMRDYGEDPVIRQTFDEASTALDTNLWTMVEAGPEAVLNQTANTQPVMLTADIAVYRAWLAAGGAQPDVAAGHSLGEYAALVAAGALKLSDAVRLVRTRGEAMQAAVPEGEGGIAAILGLDAVQVADACSIASQGEVVSPANLNAPGQIVISGKKSAVERAIEQCKAMGAKRGVMLPMSVPAHCELMKPAGRVLGDALAALDISSPAFPVVNNVDVSVVAEANGISDALIRQLHRPVRWIEVVTALETAHGATHIVECGPGKVLHGLVRRIVSNSVSMTLSSSQAIRDTIGSISQGSSA
ncbi:MAG: ACP S-malonyltransferase [Burkholderiales bacterium]